MTDTSTRARQHRTLSQVCNGETRMALYRFYDAKENLLYVGISNDPWRRWREHVLTQSWYPQVKHQSITWYNTEAEAAQVELRAIRSESPPFNKAGALRPPDTRFHVRVTVIANLAGILGATWMVGLTVALAAHSTVLLVAACTAALSSILIGGAGMVILCAPWIARSIQWLERNFDAPEPEGK